MCAQLHFLLIRLRGSAVRAPFGYLLIENAVSIRKKCASARNTADRIYVTPRSPEAENEISMADRRFSLARFLPAWRARKRSELRQKALIPSDIVMSYTRRHEDTDTPIYETTIDVEDPRRR